jgi:DNA-binding response OmpR family regulator
MARILVVDDEESVRELLCTVLSRKGHEVLLADGGRKGLVLFEQRRPQVTILDLHMPELHGIEVLRRIRARDPQAPVIILTGYSTAEAESTARMLGVTQFLQKGFSLHELGAAVREALGESAPQTTGARRLAS